MVLLGFHSGGFPKSAVTVAQQYSPIVMSVVQVYCNNLVQSVRFINSQMIATASLIAGSFVIPILTPTNTFNEWRNVFSLYAAVLVICNTIFVILARGEPAKWTSMVSLHYEN